MKFLQHLGAFWELSGVAHRAATLALWDLGDIREI